MQPPEQPPVDGNFLSQRAHQVAEKFSAGDQHAALQKLRNETFGLNDKGAQKFFQDLAAEAQKMPNHHLPGLEITQGSGDQLKVLAHDGKKTDVLYNGALAGQGQDRPHVRPPQRTADGGVTTYDAHNNATTRWANGGERVKNKDGTGYVKTPDGKGGYHEHHWGPKAADNTETDRKIENTGGADRAFQKRVGDAYSKLPDGVRRKLDQAGIHVITTGKFTDVHPEMTGQHARGYPAGMDYGAVDGAFDGTNIIVPEHSTSKFNLDPEGIVRHESGHAFDKALGGYSNSKEFNDAYQKDLAKLTPEQKKQVEYYQQKDGAGQRELFAELFCTATGGRPDKNHFPLDMAKLFPETYKAVQKKINEAH